MKRTEYREFNGGYAEIATEEFDALFEAMRLEEPSINKQALRWWAARKELSEQPEDGTVTLHRILNCGRGRKMSWSDVEKVELHFRHIERRKVKGTPFKKVPRSVLRDIAQGGLTVSEVKALLYYFYRRIPRPKKAPKAVGRKRAYARIKLRDFKATCGIERGLACRTLKKLHEKGYLTNVRKTTKVPQQNVNGYGGMFVDGLAVASAQASTDETANSGIKHSAVFGNARGSSRGNGGSIFGNARGRQLESLLGLEPFLMTESATPRSRSATPPLKIGNAKKDKPQYKNLKKKTSVPENLINGSRRIRPATEDEKLEARERRRTEPATEEEKLKLREQRIAEVNAINPDERMREAAREKQQKSLKTSRN